MKEKWFGEKCKYQVCTFETDGEGVEDRSYPVLVFCGNSDNKNDCEGNCTRKLCPLIKINK